MLTFVRFSALVLALVTARAMFNVVVLGLALLIGCAEQFDPTTDELPCDQTEWHPYVTADLRAPTLLFEVGAFDFTVVDRNGPRYICDEYGRRYLSSDDTWRLEDGTLGTIAGHGTRTAASMCHWVEPVGTVDDITERICQ